MSAALPIPGIALGAVKYNIRKYIPGQGHLYWVEINRRVGLCILVLGTGLGRNP
jgi:hypothetical protein